MIPPKKSQAARAEASKENSGEKAVTANGSKDEADIEENEAEDFEEVNIFKTEIVDGKRTRSEPSALTRLDSWIAEHLEAHEDVTLQFGQVYGIYLENCIGDNAYGVEQHIFSKKLKEKFGRGGVVMKEGSVYCDVIKPKKIRKNEAKPKTKSDAKKLIMKDVIKETLKELNNPSKGIRFFNLKTAIASKYPSLNLLRRPFRLKNELEKGVAWGYIELVKGMGLTGFYRLPGDSTETKDKVKKEGKEKEEEKDGEEKKEDKESSEEADKDDNEDGKEDKEKDAGKDEKDKEKTENKKKKKRKPESRPARKIIHSDPHLVEDTFFMAMTYMAEPKEASVTRIKRYLSTHYQKDPAPERFNSLMTDGVEKGMWEQVSGFGGKSGTYRLALTEFDPTDDKDLQGMVINAIMSSHEPKICSAKLLKRYVMEFHPKFNLTEKPHLLKNALDRAISKNLIRRISGIGLSGSFHLVKPFIPSPRVLAGIDTASDYESDSDDDDDDDDVDDKADVMFADGFKLSQFQDAYKPRPSKRQGKARAAAGGAVNDRPTSVSSPQARSARPARPKPKAQPTKRRAPSSDDSESESSEEEEVKPTPRKRAPPSPKTKPKPKPKATPKRKTPVKQEVDSDSEAETARKKLKRTPAKKSPAESVRSRPSRSPQKKYVEVSESEDDEDDKIEVKSPAKKAAPKKSNKSPKGKQLKVATVAARGRKGPPPKSRMTPSSDEETSSEEEEVYKALPSKSRTGKSRGKTPEKASPKSSPKKGSSKKRSKKR